MTIERDPSGPQVVEDWRGVPYRKSLTRTREYIAIIRQILAREKPLEFHGSEYEIPASGPSTTGSNGTSERPLLPIPLALPSDHGRYCAHGSRFTA